MFRVAYAGVLNDPKKHEPSGTASKAVLAAFALIGAVAVLLTDSAPAGAQANACNGGFAVNNTATGCGPNQGPGVGGALAPNSTAIGNQATAEGNDGIAIGLQPTSNTGSFGIDSIAIGTNPAAGNGFDINGRGQNAIAIGTNSRANFGFGANAVVVGGNSSANGNNSRQSERATM
jgi:Head domain of trimeric autotransporter adhesin